MAKSKVTPIAAARQPAPPTIRLKTPGAGESRTPSLTPGRALRLAYLAVEGILWRAESERYDRDDVRKDLIPVSQMLLDAAWLTAEDTE